MKVLFKLFAAFVCLFGLHLNGFAQEEIGSVDTAFVLIGSNHKVVVEVFDDPLVAGAACYLSRAKTGGVMGTIGLAEDRSEMSIACRQTGVISFKGPLPKQEEVFNQKISALFKHIRVLRMVDSKRNVLVYLTISDKVIDGSPQNSVTAIPVEAKIPLKK